MGLRITRERNIQILISLLKAHGIKRIIASPGMTNVSFVASVQSDPFFSVYSCVDERSASYMACGMAAESGEPVVISCTGATASRNYYSALTEAFYRQLPILAVTSSQSSMRIGQNIPQITDRGHVPPDVVKYSVELPTVKTQEEEWYCNLKANEALLELRHRGTGPVHINLITTYDQDFSTYKLSEERVIQRIYAGSAFPEMIKGRILVFVGAHKKWDESLTDAVDSFCERYNAAVVCDVTSNYKGKYGVNACLVSNQRNGKIQCCFADLAIHIGAVSGSYMSIVPAAVWRVNPDGKAVDSFKRLTRIFEMDELSFFHHYVSAKKETDEVSYYHEWNECFNSLSGKIPELPFSCMWVAKETAPKLPDGARVHFGILNALRCWNYTDFPKTSFGFCNVGGFGIDGCMSSMIGSSLVNQNLIHIGFFGDLAFFYDMNVLGNRHVGRNIRIVLVNNGRGFEFKKYDCFPVASGVEDIDLFISAAGHFSAKSSKIVKDLAENFGFEYLSASNKVEYQKILPRIVSPELSEKPLLVELFTNENDESDAQFSVEHLTEDSANAIKSKMKSLLGEKAIRKMKEILR